MSRMIVAIEGPSGIGKSSVVPHVLALLVDGNQHFRAVSNVESTSLSALIRELAGATQPGLALSLALSAARAVLLERFESNLLFDRYVLSSLVYQTFSGVDRKYVYASNAPLLAGVVTILLEASAGALVERRTARAPGRSDFFKDRLSVEEELSLFADGAELLRRHGHTVLSLDACGTVREVARKAADLILGWERADG